MTTEKDLEVGRMVIESTNGSGDGSNEKLPEISIVGEEQQEKRPPKFNEQANYLPVSGIIIVFLASSTISLLAVMDQTTLAAAMTIIGNELNARSQVAWIAGAYFLTSTSFQLLYGRLSDIWSRKVVLLVGIGIMFFGSLAASLAQNATQLIVFRAITGVGGGGLMSVAQMIVSDVVPLRERGKYQGILGAVFALANGIGPVIGGALASRSRGSWRWIFRLNLPLSVLSTIAVIFFMPLREVKGHWKEKVMAIDWIGSVAALSGSTVLMLGLTWAGGNYPWSSTHVIAPIVVGGIVSILFVLWQWKGAKLPLLPLYVFKQKVVTGACVTTFVNGWNFLVQVYYIPSFYQLVYGYSAVKAGTLLLPITVVQTFASTASGWVVHWTGRYRESILLGWAIWAISLGLFSTLDQNSGLGKQIGYAILTGIGVGQTLQPSLIAVQAGVSRADMAVVTGARNFVRNLGGTLGLAIAGTILNNYIRRRIQHLALSESDIQTILNHPERFAEVVKGAEDNKGLILEAYQAGFRTVFIISAVLSAVSFFVALALMPQVGLEREDDEKLKKEGKERHEKVWGRGIWGRSSGKK